MHRSILPSWKVLWPPIPDLYWSLAGFSIHKNSNFCHFGVNERFGLEGTSHPNVVAGLIPEEALTIINSLCLISTIISILVAECSHIHVAGVPLAACRRNSKEIFPGTLQLLPHLLSLLATPTPGLERPKFAFFFIFSNSEFPCFLQVRTKREATCHGRQGSPQRKFPRSTNSTCRCQGDVWRPQAPLWGPKGDNQFLQPWPSPLLWGNSKTKFHS